MGTLEIPQSDRLCLVALRIKDYTNELSNAERVYACSVSKVRREQYSSGRRAAQLGLNCLSITEVPILLDERKPNWPASIVGSISHTQDLAVALVGFKQDFQGVGIDILSKFAVTDKVRDRVLLEQERKFVFERENEDWQTKLFCAKEAIYKACNPETSEFLGFKDVRVQVETSGLEFQAESMSRKLSTTLITCGRGYVINLNKHWVAIFLIQ